MQSLGSNALGLGVTLGEAGETGEALAEPKGAFAEVVGAGLQAATPQMARTANQPIVDRAGSRITHPTLRTRSRVEASLWHGFHQL
jgi:hypothetical protein